MVVTSTPHFSHFIISLLCEFLYFPHIQAPSFVGPKIFSQNRPPISAFKVLVKELQSLALDVRVLDRDGEEIELSELCNEDDTSRVSRSDADAIDAILGQRVADDELRKSFLVDDDEDDADAEDEDSDSFFGTEEEIYGEEFLGESDDE